MAIHLPTTRIRAEIRDRFDWHRAGKAIHESDRFMVRRVSPNRLKLGVAPVRDMDTGTPIYRDMDEFATRRNLLDLIVELAEELERRGCGQ